MNRLNASGMREAAGRRGGTRPHAILGICVGMQMLAEAARKAAASGCRAACGTLTAPAAWMACPCPIWLERRDAFASPPRRSLPGWSRTRFSCTPSTSVPGRCRRGRQADYDGALHRNLGRRGCIYGMQGHPRRATTGALRCCATSLSWKPDHAAPGITPCLLVHEGGLVKTVGFRDPNTWATRSMPSRSSTRRSDGLIVLDIDATRLGKKPDYKLIQDLAANAACRWPTAAACAPEQAKRIGELASRRSA